MLHILIQLQCPDISSTIDLDVITKINIQIIIQHLWKHLDREIFFFDRLPIYRILPSSESSTCSILDIRVKRIKYYARDVG